MTAKNTRARTTCNGIVMGRNAFRNVRRYKLSDRDVGSQVATQSSEGVEPNGGRPCLRKTENIRGDRPGPDETFFERPEAGPNLGVEWSRVSPSGNF